MKLIRTLARISGLTLVLALVPACSSGSDTEAGTGAKAATSEKIEPYSCGSVARLHTFGSLFLASQPSPADFEQAQKNGVRTVINLRHDSEIKDFDERRVVTDLGMVYVHEPFDSPEELTDAVFDRCRQLLATAERPILLHCNSANRVGAVWIAWRVLDGGLPLEQAVAEAKTIGLKAPALEERARAYVAQHARGS